MRESAFVFLRGTFYRWMEVWPDRCGSLDEAPRVLGVGDLHLENFGTWRDADRRLIWGVNYVDEACRIPYTLDLVRLATSALLAIREGHLALTVPSACEAIVDGYESSIDAGGKAFSLEGRHAWLRDAALVRARDPERSAHYWTELKSCPPASGGLPSKKLRAQLPDPEAPCTFLRRVTGVGSLGRRRFVAIAAGSDGTPVAREAKALLPSAASWARGKTHPKIYLEKLLAHAVRVPDPCVVVTRHWIIRRLAPDCARIDLGDLPAERDELKLLRAMGWETANLHMGRKRVDILADLKGRPKRWLETSALAMADSVETEWRGWVKRA